MSQAIIKKTSDYFKSKGVVLPSISELQDPQIINDDIKNFLSKFDSSVIEQAEVRLKYDGYIQKEKELVDKMNRLEDIGLNPNFNYAGLNSLSSEAREKLSEIKPSTIGQASRISGVSPSDIAVLMVAIGR